MAQVKLTIQLVGWNSSKDLKQNLPSVLALANGAVIRYIDNASTDDSVVQVRSASAGIEIVELTHNIGYASANNVGFALCETPFVLTLNPDVAIDTNGITRLLAAMEQNSNIGAIQGLLLRPGTPEVIDSAGIVRTITLNGMERGARSGKPDVFTGRESIDAVTGACGLFRMKALQSVAHGQYEVDGKKALEVFDKDFFAYKEDVDLGWRLQRANWEIIYEPVLTGYHARMLKNQGIAGWGIRPAAIIRRLRSERTRMSFRNYAWLVVKNASGKELLLHELFIDIRLLFFFLLSLVYWPLLPVWGEILRGLPDMLHKRSHETIDHNG